MRIQFILKTNHKINKIRIDNIILDLKVIKIIILLITQMKSNIILFYLIGLSIIDLTLGIRIRKDNVPEGTLALKIAPGIHQSFDSNRSGNKTLSLALYSVDSYKKYKKNDFIKAIEYSNYQLSRGELEEMFDFIDTNHDLLVDKEEWQKFVQVFVFPFEKCDIDHNYLLDETQLKQCFENDPSSKQIGIVLKEQGSFYKNIIDLLSFNNHKTINLFSYLILRRAMFSWNSCHSDFKYMSLQSFKCAIRISAPDYYLYKVNIDEMYSVGLKLANEPSSIQLTFTNYCMIVFYVHAFRLLGANNDNVLYKNAFIKAQKEGRISTNFDNEEISTIFDISSEQPYQQESYLDFSSFCFYYNAHRLFNRYSKERPTLLSKDEFNTLIEDPLFPVFIKHSIDSSVTNFNETLYKQASGPIYPPMINEKDFYYSFKSVNNTYTSKYETKPNKENREVFFSILTGANKNYITKEEFYRGLVFGQIFVTLADEYTWILPMKRIIRELPKKYDTMIPSIGYKYKEGYSIFTDIPIQLKVDILLFLTIENFRFKLKETVSNENKDVLDSTSAHIILNDCGMKNIPLTDFSNINKGIDSIMRKTYEPYSFIKKASIIQAIAAEIKRDEDISNKINK